MTVPWLRGYREETIVAGRGYDPETLGRDALGVLDAIGVSSAVLVGHDWGALSAYTAAALAPERIRAIATAGIPHPSVLERTPSAFRAVRHFLTLKLPWAPRMCRRRDFAYLDHLYRRWSPSWYGPERDESVSRVKQALSSPATLAGAIGYYRDLPLARQPSVNARVPQVQGLIIGDGRPRRRRAVHPHAQLLAQPSRALIVECALPHRESRAVTQLSPTSRVSGRACRQRRRRVDGQPREQAARGGLRLEHPRQGVLGGQRFAVPGEQVQAFAVERARAGRRGRCRRRACTGRVVVAAVQREHPLQVDRVVLRGEVEQVAEAAAARSP